MRPRIQGTVKEDYGPNACPNRYMYTVCGILDTNAPWTWKVLSSVKDADLCLSSLFYVAFLTLESLALTVFTRDRGRLDALWPGTKKRVLLQRIQCIRKSNTFLSLLTLSWSICVLQSRQAWACDSRETAWAEKTCWNTYGMGLDERGCSRA